MQTIYKSPEMEIVEFTVDDVITTSQSGLEHITDPNTPEGSGEWKDYFG